MILADFAHLRGEADYEYENDTGGLPAVAGPYVLREQGYWTMTSDRSMEAVTLGSFLPTGLLSWTLSAHWKCSI
jgi:hypothetical protein